MKKLIIVLIGLSLFACTKKEVNKEVVEPLKTQEVAEAEPEVIDYSSITNLWDENHEKNDEYVGKISFKSKLVDLGFVHTSDNEKYLNLDWETMENKSHGSVFMDFRNNLEDQNIILYGHYVYLSKDPSGTKIFTPLRFLTDENEYEANKYFSLELENEIRHYEIAYVYYSRVYEDGLASPDTPYYLTNFTEEEFNDYKRNMEANALYDTGVDLSYSDKTVTLQTCVERRNDLREIIVAKEIDVVKTR